MREIAYFMLEPRAREAPSICLGSRALRWETPRLERFLWHGYRVSLYLFPCRLEGTKRLRWWMERIGSALEEQGTALWLTPELEAAWEDWQPPLPDAALAAEILRGQPFRENLVLLADAEKTAGQWSRGRENGIRPVSRLWQEDFLRLVSADLNGLYLVGQKEAAWEHFSDWLYGESGLPVCFVNRIPETDGRKTVLVELRANARILKEHPEFGSLYVDLTSDVEKRRQIREKRADISYISARNYLDTALKARYNAI